EDVDSNGNVLQSETIRCAITLDSGTPTLRRASGTVRSTARNDSTGGSARLDFAGTTADNQTRVFAATDEEGVLRIEDETPPGTTRARGGDIGDRQWRKSDASGLSPELVALLFAGANALDFARIRGKIIGDAPGTEDGAVEIAVLVDAVMTTIAEFARDGISFLGEPKQGAGTVAVPAGSLRSGGQVIAGTIGQLLDSGAFSGVAAVDLTTGFASTFSSYMLDLRVQTTTPGGNATFVELQASSDGGSTFGLFEANPSLVRDGIRINTSSSTANAVVLAEDASSAGEVQQRSMITIQNDGASGGASRSVVSSQGTRSEPSTQSVASYGRALTNSDVNALRVLHGDGGTLTGYYRLYGINNA
ncbi:MAG: hypothetical protein AAFQ81_05625, partial [Pseudomonadota bacterium]